MEFHHVPVLLNECMDGLAIDPAGTYLDGTAGGAGHSREIAKRLTTGRLIALDQDPDAVATATERLKGLPARVVRANFRQAPQVLAELGIGQINGALLDLGVSSHQLDDAARGFSYHADAPLDMRMDREQALSAREIVNEWPAQEIARILRDYAEEKWAVRIAQIIAEHRAQKPLETTADLVACVDAAIPRKVRMQDSGHSARRTFQALRIAVNDELEPLARALEDMAGLLNPGGRLAVITFHSLEDRIVKQTFRRLANPCTCPPKIPVCICGKKPVVKVLGGGGIKPGAEEIAVNARSRSAMLRGCEKL